MTEEPSAELQQALRDAGDQRSEVVRAFVASQRAALRDLHDGGTSGIAVVERWTRSMDQLACSLFSALGGSLGHWLEESALVALGGFGRSELSPRSDLDLLLLHEGTDDLAPMVQELLYPLWDAGLEVQCVARTVEENLDIARQSVPSRSNLLDSRFLCGAAGLAARFEREVVQQEILGRETERFVEALLRDREARHERFGQTVYLLEPNVKSGEGGLRDIHTALAVARVRFKVGSHAGLVQKGLVPRDEVQALVRAMDFLLRIRNHLHFASGRKEDRLTVALQDEVAESFGYRDTPSALGAEELLQRYYTCANQVGHFSRLLIRRAQARLKPGATATASTVVLSEGILLQAGEIQLNPDAVEHDPLNLLRVFEAAQSQQAELSPQTLAIVRDHLHRIDDRFRRDPEAVRMFLGILQAPRHVATTLMAMHDVRFLDRFIPEMARVFGLVQRDFYHAYPVDVHSLFAVQELRRLARGEHDEEFPRYAELMRSLQRPHILYLATLLHDVGKGAGRAHEQRGAELAIQVADRMDLDPAERDYLEFLVRQHLLLSYTAQNRDLHDEELIRDFAGRVGDLEALKMLHLLTFADARAVGPGAWTGWKQALFEQLFEKTRQVLAGERVQRGATAERVRAVEERLRAMAGPLAPAEEVEAFLENIEHPRYLTANSIEALLRHLALFLQRAQAPVIDLRAVPEEDYTEVLLLTRDRPGLFAQVAGLMAAHGINILSAVLNTRKDRWVLDVFHVSLPSGEPLDSGQRWNAWRTDAVAVLSGERTLQDALGTKLEPRRSLQRPRPRGGATVRVDNTASRSFTVVDVAAADRLGLLYDLARALAEHGLTIRLAKLVTRLHRVADSFYVETLEGGKLTDPQALEQLQDRLLILTQEDSDGEDQT